MMSPNVSVVCVRGGWGVGCRQGEGVGLGWGLNVGIGGLRLVVGG